MKKIVAIVVYVFAFSMGNLAFDEYSLVYSIDEKIKLFEVTLKSGKKIRTQFCQEKNNLICVTQETATVCYPKESIVAIQEIEADQGQGNYKFESSDMSILGLTLGMTSSEVKKIFPTMQNSSGCLFVANFRLEGIFFNLIECNFEADKLSKVWIVIKSDIADKIIGILNSKYGKPKDILSRKKFDWEEEPDTVWYEWRKGDDYIKMWYSNSISKPNNNSSITFSSLSVDNKNKKNDEDEALRKTKVLKEIF